MTQQTDPVTPQSLRTKRKRLNKASPLDVQPDEQHPDPPIRPSYDQEPVEKRPGVSIVTPEDYPKAGRDRM